MGNKSFGKNSEGLFTPRFPNIERVYDALYFIAEERKYKRNESIYSSLLKDAEK